MTFIDDGDPVGYSQVGAWFPGSAGFAGTDGVADSRQTAIGALGNQVTWDAELSPGRYNVAVTWTISTFNPAESASYEILDGSTSLGAFTVDQSVSPQNTPGSFLDGGVYWVRLGTPVQLSGNQMSVRLKGAIDGFAVADAVRIQRQDNPEIEVLDGANSLVDGAGTVNFGTTVAGTPVTRVLTIRNTGVDDLVVGPNASIVVPDGFILAPGLADTVVPPGGQTTLTLQLDGAPGSYSGTLSIPNNDADESPFEVTLTGDIEETPIVGPEIRVTIGSTQLQDGTSVVDYESTSLGVPVSRTFTVTNIGTEDLSLGQITAPAGYTVSGSVQSVLAPGGSTSFVVTLDATAVGTFGGTLSIVNNDADESPFDVALTGKVIEGVGPDIEVRLGGTDDVPDGGPVQFEPTVVGSPRLLLLVVRNVGDGTLLLSDAITLPEGFSLLDGIDATTLEPGATTSLVVQLDAATTGIFGGEVSIATNDPDENPFSFTLQGVVASRPGPDAQVTLDGEEIIDGIGSVDLGATLLGEPIVKTVTITNVGTEDLILPTSIAVPPGFSVVDTFDTPVLLPGQSTTFDLVLDATAEGTPTGVIQFETNDADDPIFDFVVSGKVSVARLPKVQVSVGGSEVLDDTGSVSFGTTPVGSPVDITFTVRNLGNGYLALPGSISLPPGFSLVSNFGLRVLMPGTMTTFTVRMNAAAPGAFSGMLAFSTSDPDHPMFNVSIAGTAT